MVKCNKQYGGSGVNEQAVEKTETTTMTEPVNGNTTGAATTNNGIQRGGSRRKHKSRRRHKTKRRKTNRRKMKRRRGGCEGLACLTDGKSLITQ